MEDSVRLEVPSLLAHSMPPHSGASVRVASAITARTYDARPSVSDVLGGAGSVRPRGVFYVEAGVISPPASLTCRIVILLNLFLASPLGSLPIFQSRRVLADVRIVLIVPWVPTMRKSPFGRRCLSWVLAGGVGCGTTLTVLADPPEAQPGAPPVIATSTDERLQMPKKQDKEKDKAKDKEKADPSVSDSVPLSAILGVDAAPIDLGSALQLAGVGNPAILLSRQRVVEAVALKQQAAAQILPDLHPGLSYDDHNGNLQQSNGTIIKVDRNNLYMGAGANAIAAGSVSIPGVYWAGNVSQAVFGILIAKQEVEIRQLASKAVELEMLLRVAVTYNELLRSEGLYAIARRTLEDAREVERLTAVYARTQAGRQADADRARTEREQRQAALPPAEGQTLIVSARLAELLNLPPTCRLVVVDNKVIPCPVVPDPIPLPQLLTIAILNRPELQERQAVIRQALLSVDSAKMLPFSPTVILGLSYGEEGGGSNLVHPPPNVTNAQQGVLTIPGTANFAAGQPRFGNFNERVDFDAITFWALDNLAFGNKARILAARSELGIAQLQFLEQLDRVRAEVANAYARTHARFAQITTAEQSVLNAMQTYASDSEAVKGGETLPIVLLESLRLLARGRYTYLNAIADYNRAQLELFVALGKPPPDMLARAMPPGFMPPAVEKEKKKEK